MTERRTLWTVSSGDYSSYRVHALYEDPSDAHAVARQIDDGRVEELPLYGPGDRSYRQGTIWRAEVIVHADGSLGPPVARTYDYEHVDSSGPLDPGDIWAQGGLQAAGWYRVAGTGTTKKQAIKGTKDRAAEVAAMILDGVDPREIIWGRPREYEITSAHEAALIWEARLQEEREAAARALRKASLVTQWVNRQVGLFDGDTQVGEWVAFGVGHIPLPESFNGDPRQLQLRDEHGAIAAPEVEVGQVLRLKQPPLRAVMWPRVPTVTEIGDDVFIGDPSLSTTPAS